jgi:hypothetical protein
MKELDAIVLTALLAASVLGATDIVYPVFAEKNPQAECIKGQNEGFVGNEQKGDAYKQSKDTCQELSK